MPCTKIGVAAKSESLAFWSSAILRHGGIVPVKVSTRNIPPGMSVVIIALFPHEIAEMVRHVDANPPGGNVTCILAVFGGSSKDHIPLMRKHHRIDVGGTAFTLVNDMSFEDIVRREMDFLLGADKFDKSPESLRVFHRRFLLPIIGTGSVRGVIAAGIWNYVAYPWIVKHINAGRIRNMSILDKKRLQMKMNILRDIIGTVDRSREMVDVFNILCNGAVIECDRVLRGCEGITAGLPTLPIEELMEHWFPGIMEIVLIFDPSPSPVTDPFPDPLEGLLEGATKIPTEEQDEIIYHPLDYYFQ